MQSSHRLDHPSLLLRQGLVHPRCPPSRRSSVVPPKTATSTATKASAPPTASKPAPATATSAPARHSVVSPSGSVASLKSGVTSHRPRPSVSEGVKRATPSSTKPASSAATKAATATTKTAPSRSSTIGAATKAAGPSGSISSTHEIKSGKDSEELRNKVAQLLICIRSLIVILFVAQRCYGRVNFQSPGSQ